MEYKSNISNIIVTVYFTFDTSLVDWDKTGIFHREIDIYKRLQEKGTKFQFITYGDKNDLSYQDRLNGIKILPLYSRVTRSKNRFLRLIKSFLIPLTFKNEIKHQIYLKLIKFGVVGLLSYVNDLQTTFIW